MRKALATGFAGAAGIVLLLALKPHQTDVPVGGAAPAAPPAGAGSSHSAAGGPSRSGTFTGSTVSTKYGPVQVAVVLKNGKITAVKAVRTPSGNGRDREIARSAVPQLTREVLAKQSASVQAVSGASYTSAGYLNSLQSALDRSHG